MLSRCLRGSAILLAYVNLCTAAAAGADRFMLGADVSWVQEQEEGGMQFSDRGKPADFFALMHTNGFDWIRLRLFHTPSHSNGYSRKGYCDLPHTVAMAQRARAAGFRLLLDFHYSDNWADPGKQFRPAAWRDLDDRALAAAVHDYTRASLEAFRKAGCLPDMVQIGNEISNGMLWSREKEGIRDWDALAGWLKAGIAAVRETDPAIRTMLHLAAGGDARLSRWFLDAVALRGVPFDVIGQSYYPQWHGTLDDLKANLTDLAQRYPQPIVVVEYSAPTFREVNEIVRGLPGGKGIGTFIWEPTKWPSERQAALFEKSGAAKPELQFFSRFRRECDSPR